MFKATFGFILGVLMCALWFGYQSFIGTIAPVQLAQAYKDQNTYGEVTPANIDMR